MNFWWFFFLAEFDAKYPNYLAHFLPVISGSGLVSVSSFFFLVKCLPLPHILQVETKCCIFFHVMQTLPQYTKLFGSQNQIISGEKNTFFLSKKEVAPSFVFSNLGADSAT